MNKIPLHCIIREEHAKHRNAICGTYTVGFNQDFDDHYVFIEIVNKERMLYTDNYLCEDCLKALEYLVFR